MRVPGIIYANAAIMPDVQKDESCTQVYNVAHLPGIVGKSIALPDVHWGYGFPIGGVAAFDEHEGVVSPGGVGYDINCGVRMALTSLRAEDLGSGLRDVVDALFTVVPTGVGSGGGMKLRANDFKTMLRSGAQWAVSRGMGEESDLVRIEDGGCLEMADPQALSTRARDRGKTQAGTLGSGNHFMEIGEVAEILDHETARVWGVEAGTVTLMIHTGSRGLGHQVCDDFLARMVKNLHKTQLTIPDKQLACAQLNTPLADEYIAAMSAAANFAYANRQILMHLARETLEQALGIAPRDLRMRLLYDVCHNIAKMETHTLDGRAQRVCVHRKGATRALPARHPLLPPEFSTTGQPVIIPGDMGRASYLLAGEPGALEQTFGSACHGAGRVLSRKGALNATKGRAIERELQDKGIYPRSAGRKTLREEFPEAYKDVSQVVDVVHRAGLARTVARVRPLGVIKG